MSEFYIYSAILLIIFFVLILILGYIYKQKMNRNSKEINNIEDRYIKRDNEFFRRRRRRVKKIR